MKLPNPVAWLCTDFDGHFGLGVTKELAKIKAGEDCNDFLPLHPESAFATLQQRIEALEAELAACKRSAEETATNLRAERDTARADLATCKRDAERLDKLAKLLFAADFEYGEDGLNVLVFHWPKNVPVGPDLRRNIDAAQAAQEKA